MEAIQLKPYIFASVKIPEKLEIEVCGQIDTITYPMYGSMEEKATYLKIMNELRLNVFDENIIA